MKNILLHFLSVCTLQTCWQYFLPKIIKTGSALMKPLVNVFVIKEPQHGQHEEKHVDQTGAADAVRMITVITPRLTVSRQLTDIKQ